MWFNVLIVAVLVILAGTYAGLTLAMFSLRLSDLQTQKRAGNENAIIVYPLRKKGNLLLCTLLLGNVASYTTMSIFLGSITGGIIAGFIATSLVFVFGEIVPQAVFPRYALNISAWLSWFVKGSLVLFYPVSAPIAWILDKVLGEATPVLWSKEELGELIRYHEDVGDGIIDKDEERIILGALTFSEMKVHDIMIPKEKVFYLESGTEINQQILEKIKSMGFSRIPVYDSAESKVNGILYAKNLLGEIAQNRVEEICDKEGLVVVNEDVELDDLLNMMLHKSVHMALIYNQSEEFTGIATMEDIVEEILNTEIDDKKVQR